MYHLLHTRLFLSEVNKKSYFSHVQGSLCSVPGLHRCTACCICVGGVLFWYIRRGELETALLIVELIAVVVAAALSYGTVMCLYLLAKMLLFLVGRTIKMLLFLTSRTIQAFLHIIAESILLLLTTMLRVIYPLLLPAINGLLAAVTANKVITFYINWRKIDTASFIAEVATVTALAVLFYVAVMCLYRLLKMLLFLVKITLLIFCRLITDVILMVIITVKSLWTSLFLITVLVSAAIKVQEQMTANMPSWYGHSFLLALSITILGFRISVIMMKIISRMMRFVLNLTAKVAGACWYLIIMCMKPVVNILGWLGKWTLHVTLSFFL